MAADPLLAALDAVPDPLTGRGLVAAGRAAAPRVAGGRVDVVLDVSGLDAGARDGLAAAVRGALAAPGREVRVLLTADRAAAPRLLAVASGKGGVGKSTVAANLAVALAGLGVRVGVVDADIYGPSQPTLLAAPARPEAENNKLHPVSSPYGVRLLSMGQLVAADQAIAWRGPMAGNALTQLVDAHWGDTELLVVDLPPGTGDVQLSMIQKHRPSAALIVSTPQDLALIDAARAVDLFGKAGVPILGLVENMAGYVCPHCGEASDPFGRGGAEAEAARLHLPFLGRVPLALAIRQASDRGQPFAAAGDAAARPIQALAAHVRDWLRAER